MNQRPGAGYSGTPLATKLGFRPSSRVLLLNAPPEYHSLLAPTPEGVVFEKELGPSLDMVHLFTAQREQLQEELKVLRKKLKAEAAVWVSWPKKSSKVPTNITEGTIREVALPLGFVDIKVCAVSKIWSGLKLVVRKELR
jgi:hypothetical protein